MKIVTEAIVVDKNAKRGTGQYEGRTFYNIVLGEKKDLNGFPTMDTQVIGVPADVYQQAEVGKVNRFGGSFGGVKNKFWKFDQFLGVVENKSK